MTDMTALSRRSFILMSVALAACKPGAKTLDFSGLTMGTSYNVVAVDPSRKVNEEEAKAQIESALALVNKQPNQQSATNPQLNQEQWAGRILGIVGKTDP